MFLSINRLRKKRKKKRKEKEKKKKNKEKRKKSGKTRRSKEKRKILRERKTLNTFSVVGIEIAFRNVCMLQLDNLNAGGWSH